MWVMEAMEVNVLVLSLDQLVVDWTGTDAHGGPNQSNSTVDDK